MKKIIIIFSILVAMSNNLLAQSGCSYACTYNVGEKYYVHSDVANVRTLPDIDSEISFKLSAGQEVIIISYNNEHLDWYFIKTTDGRKREGWIWSETLSCKQLRIENTKFVFGIDKVSEDMCIFTIKVIENGKIVDRKRFGETIFGDYIDADFYSARIIDSVRLENVKCIVHLLLIANGCSHSGGGDFYFAWLDEKKKLIKLPEIFSYLADSESLYIPTENNGGIPNVLVKVTKNGVGEPIWDTEIGNKWEKYEYKSELFKWDGEKLIEINKKK